MAEKRDLEYSPGGCAYIFKHPLLHEVALPFDAVPLYSLAGAVHFEDYTMLRGLPMDFPTDRNVADISDQWMLDPALMPCPVSEYKSRYRSVYFPQCEGWYDFYTGRPLSLSSVLFGNNIPHVRCRRTPLIPLRQHFRAYSFPRRAIAFVGKFIARR